jgi:hypothetical protein
MSNPAEWWKHVGKVQEFVNAIHNRSIKKTPFELLVGGQMRLKDGQELKQLIDEELVVFDRFAGNRVRDESRQREA